MRARKHGSNLKKVGGPEHTKFPVWDTPHEVHRLMLLLLKSYGFHFSCGKNSGFIVGVTKYLFFVFSSIRSADRGIYLRDCNMIP